MTLVLVIDDDPLVRETFHDALAQAGFEVRVAGNGRRGLQACQSEAIDVVVTDLLMPERDGIETILELRRTAPATRIVAVSGGGTFDAIHLLDFAEKLGADRVVAKPVAPSELVALVGELAGDTRVRPVSGGESGTADPADPQ